MSLRMERTNELIKRQVGKILEEDIDWEEGILVTVNRAETAHDFLSSTIFISIFPTSRKLRALEILEALKKRIQALFNREIGLRRAPTLNFKVEEIE